MMFHQKAEELEKLSASLPNRVGKEHHMDGIKREIDESCLGPGFTAQEVHINVIARSNSSVMPFHCSILSRLSSPIKIVSIGSIGHWP